MIWFFLVVFILFWVGVYALSKVVVPPPIRLLGSHVLITGGSSGIGKSFAIEAAKRGANVTLLARNQTLLLEAKIEVEKNVKNSTLQRILCFSVDVTKDFSTIQRAVQQAEEIQGPISVLINCAGTSASAKFMDTPLETFKDLMDVNYLGSVMVTRAVVPSLQKQKWGRIIFVSSMAGQLGMFGYTAYSASKFALRGFAESLQMELKPFNIRVTLAFPPDTDTPGFAEEQKTKPKETKLISESGGIFRPSVIARDVLNDAVNGQFLSYIGCDGWMLSVLTSGFAPVTSACELIQEVMFMGFCRIIAFFYMVYFNKVIAQCKKEEELAQKKRT